jgi:hypothetical protein
MTCTVIWAGNGTHTGRILGYCPRCGLYHGSPAARLACADFVAAAQTTNALPAWRLLKDAVTREGASYPVGAATSARVESIAG